MASGATIAPIFVRRGFDLQPGLALIGAATALSIFLAFGWLDRPTPSIASRIAR